MQVAKETLTAELQYDGNAQLLKINNSNLNPFQLFVTYIFPNFTSLFIQT